MPYINQEDRAKLNGAIIRITNILRNRFHKDKINGPLVYIIMKTVYLAKKPESFNDHSDITKIFRRAEHEYERRILDPYEDEKILENGDIF